ncbi:hypothetical protein DFH07DRAFT_947646 [Mycena maculata]|uniref:Cupredoxin n=1 Tax=Mycena maculata TaxID=230809 RepID=A0AAD7MGT3_9AGAR|nr:hypothetical protein DFH07DRAFT_947646 [Mycena maculata]
MSISVLAVAFALLPVAFAQSTISVDVGPSGSLVYSPPSVTAAAGDFIEFTFHPKNHTVTQSSFAEPCVELEGGATSGFRPVSNVSGLLPTWTFAVADGTTPTWFYCQQTGHCGKGMVFAINAPPPPAPNSFEAFSALAIQLNGTGSASVPAATDSATSAAVTTDTSFTAPPAQSWATATATVSDASSTWTTVYTSYDGTPSPTFAASPVNHMILVGADGLTYTPSNISAAIGDTVTFEFHPKNHTVTQSSFPEPCKALAETSTTGQVGFKSGFMPVAENATSFPTFTITINDTAPIWGYCGQQGPPVHCTSGMVFSINAVESGPNNFQAFQQIALNEGNVSAAAVSGSGSGAGSTGTSTGSAAGSTQSGGALSSTSVSYAAMLALGAIGAVSALL